MASFGVLKGSAQGVSLQWLFLRVLWFLPLRYGGLCLTIAGQDAASYGAEPTCAMIVGDNS